MESAGVVLSGVSLLAGLKSAVETYRLISDILSNAATEDSRYWEVSLRVQRCRLEFWAKFYDYDFANPDISSCTRLESLPDVAKRLVCDVLKQIQWHAENLDTIADRYGIMPPSSSKDFSIRRRVQWTVAHGEKFGGLVERLRNLNNDLYGIAPYSGFRFLDFGVPSYVMSNTYFSSHSSGQMLTTLSQSKEPLLAECAKMRAIEQQSAIVSGSVKTIQLEELSTDSDTQMRLRNEPRIDIAAGWKLTAEPDDYGSHIQIEWRRVNDTLSIEHQNIASKRIQSLGVLLQEQRLAQFCLLRCLGLVEDRSVSGHKRMGYIFQYPPGTCGKSPKTLEAILQHRKSYCLGERFRLAQSLSCAILLLHSSKWLHRNIRSSSILLFFDKASEGSQELWPPLTSPYLASFEFSRPDYSNELSLERPNKPSSATGVDIYLHPSIAMQGRTSRLSDIYALGVVLFEIGFWESAESIAVKYLKSGKRGIGSHHDALIYASEKLSFLMGTAYRNVVQCCLKGDFGGLADAALDVGLWKRVVSVLHECKA